MKMEREDCQHPNSASSFLVLDFCLLGFTWFCCSLHWSWSMFMLSLVKTLRSVSTISGKVTCSEGRRQCLGDFEKC